MAQAGSDQQGGAGEGAGEETGPQLAELGPAEVAAWVAALPGRLGTHAETFALVGVDGPALVALTADDLAEEELGIPVPALRRCESASAVSV
jgi:hypothetical protein